MADQGIWYGEDNNKFETVDISGESTLFKEISDSDMSRTKGEIEMLIGADCSILLPVNIESAGNLQLMKNQFGYCLRGSHSMLKLSAIPKDAYTSIICLGLM